MRFLKMLMIMLTVAFVLLLITLPGVVGLFLAAIAGVGAYFANMYASIEYEYLYVDKEISVDKVLAKSKRKKAGSYTLDTFNAASDRISDSTYSLNVDVYVLFR